MLAKAGSPENQEENKTRKADDDGKVNSDMRLTRKMMIISQIQEVKAFVKDLRLEPDYICIPDADLNDVGVQSRNQDDIDSSKRPTSSSVLGMMTNVKCFLDNRWMQLFLYVVQLAFLIIVCVLLRAPSQWYLFRNIDSMFIQGSDQGPDVRTPADLWKWGRDALLPSIFSNTDDAEAWPDGFTPPLGPMTNATLCEEPSESVVGKDSLDCEELSGGVSEFRSGTSTPYNIEELLEVYSNMHTEVQLQMVRTPTIVPNQERGFVHRTKEENIFVRNSETATYGYGFEGEEGSPELKRQKFTWLSAKDLGHKHDDRMYFSPRSESNKHYTLAGYNAFLVPFFSEVYLGPEDCHDSDETCVWVKSASEGFAEECLLDSECMRRLVDMGLWVDGAANEEKEALTVKWTASGNDTWGGRQGLGPPKRRHGNYQCIRTSLNGLWIRQICDPVSKASRRPIQGVVKNHAFAFWQELQDHRFVDFQTRFLMISLQIHSENAKLESNTQLVFEFPLSGGIASSSLLSTARADRSITAEVSMWLHLTLAIFIVLQLYEALCFVVDGWSYVYSFWNWLDTVNFALFVAFFSMLSANYIDEVI
jgi:hypothetical protein